MNELTLKRPLAIFDIEATGANPRTDRIVELAIVKLISHAKKEQHVFRINPGIPIPREVTRIHGITDADIAACPPFRTVAPEILKIFEGCDLCGYNVLRFDIPMLMEECLRVGLRFDIDDRFVVDPQRIFHRKEPRDLTAALAFYSGEMHLDAHGALPDALATLRVLEGQLARYSDLPHEVENLDTYCNPKDPSWVDRTGKLRWQNGQIVLNFGRKKDVPLRELMESDPGFIKWMIRSDFPRDVVELLENAQAGRWPSPPKAEVET